jgi:hypothetical protein
MAVSRFKAGAWLLWFVVTGSLFLVAAIAKSIQAHSFFEVARYLGVGQSALGVALLLIAWGVWVVGSGGARSALSGTATPGDIERSRS